MYRESMYRKLMNVSKYPRGIICNVANNISICSTVAQLAPIACFPIVRTCIMMPMLSCGVGKPNSLARVGARSTWSTLSGMSLSACRKREQERGMNGWTAVPRLPDKYASTRLTY